MPPPPPRLVVRLLPVCLVLLATACEPTTALSLPPEVAAPSPPLTPETPADVAKTPGVPPPPAVSSIVVPGALTPFPKTDVSVPPRPDAGRVAQIAAVLAPRPAGLGRPITDRAAWAFAARQPAFRRTVADAEAALRERTPELPDALFLEYTKNGNRSNYEKPFNERSERLCLFTLAECLENRGRFLPAVVAELRAILAEKTWTVPAHDGKLDNFEGRGVTVDLAAAARASTTATVDYWLGGRLPADLRAALRRELQRRVFEPFLSREASGKLGAMGWMRSGNNWNAVCHSGVVGAALAVIENPTERARFIAAAEENSRAYLDGFGPDGYCSEGLGYWNYGFGNFVLLMETVRQATAGRLDLFQDDQVKLVAEFPRRQAIAPNVYPAFGDAGLEGRPSRWALEILTRRFDRQRGPRGEITSANAGKHPLGEWLARTALVTFTDWPESAAGTVAKVSREDEEPLPLRDWFPEGGVLVVRPATPDPDVLAAALKGGHNAEDHNHNDNGSYVVAVRGKPLLVDPGTEAYTRRTFSSQRYVSTVLNSLGHPVPVVAGQLQQEGRRARAEILQTDFSPKRDVYAMELKSGYPVPELQGLQRTFTYERAGRGTLTVLDEVQFDRPTAFGTALVTLSQWKSLGHSALLIHDGNRALRVDIQTTGAPVELKAEELPDGTRPTRLGLNFTQPVTAGSIRLTIRPAEPPPEVNVVGPGFQPQVERAVTIEAETLAGQSGGNAEVVTNKPGASGTALRGWDDKDHRLAWRVNVPATGRYALQLRVCHGSGGPARRRLLMDNQPVPGAEGPFDFPGTGGFSNATDDWRDQWLTTCDGRGVKLPLTAGAHILTLVNDDGKPLNLDWLRLTPVD